ncbi:MAG TPA: ATP-binding cassette domain-containing protein [Terriglobales bacterium]|nr:ATP-binding cassette domain-containing protein [Terriglobales bacterium]
MAPAPALLDMQNVRVMRGDKVVLDDFNLRINAGEHVAVLGPNGCGKSTLVKTIARECYPVVREGSSMTILGRDRWNVFELRSLLGIVSNDLMSACTGKISGGDVVLSGFFSSTRIFPHHNIDPAYRQLAVSALEQLQIAHLGDRPVAEMSSGEAKRVLVARALVHKPGALLFDEPSNSLDFFARHELRQTMSALANAGITIVLVTHDLADIVPEVGRVVLMSGGRILADGTKDQILESARLSTLFGMTVEIARREGYYHLW